MEATIACKHCDKQNPIGAKYCTRCGQPLAPLIAKNKLLYCPECGERVKKGEGNCPNCGADLSRFRRPLYGPAHKDSMIHKPGNMLIGVIVGFGIAFALSWIPVLGIILAGLAAGLISYGAGRGALAGFAVGLLSIPHSIIFAFGIDITVLSLIFGNVAASAPFLSSLENSLVMAVALVLVLPATLGGLLGGYLKARGARKLG